MGSMSFEQRKKVGMQAEEAFEIFADKAHIALLPLSKFKKDDYTTTTASMPPEVKYLPDYRVEIDWEWGFVEVKNSIFWNQAECDYQKTLPNLYLWVQNRLVKFFDVKLAGPYPGSKNGSGMPYYRVIV